MSNPVITITMENGDVMKGELYPEIAPNTCSFWQIRHAGGTGAFYGTRIYFSLR